MKTCSKCKQNLPLHQFSKDTKSPDGKQHRCKECTNKNNSKENPKRMHINGKYISNKHTLHKPGYYKALDDAWSHVEIDNKSTRGHVYIIGNPAFEGWYKVGKAVDAVDRLNNYQTCSPMRDYVLHYYCKFNDRHNAEVEVHSRLRQSLSYDEYQAEWFNATIDGIISIIEEVKDEEADTGYRDESGTQYDLGLCN